MLAAIFTIGDQTMDNLNEPKFQIGNQTEAGSQADLAVNNSVSSKTLVRLVTLVALSVFFSEILVMLMLPQAVAILNFPFQKGRLKLQPPAVMLWLIFWV